MAGLSAISFIIVSVSAGVRNRKSEANTVKKLKEKSTQQKIDDYIDEFELSVKLRN